MDRSLRPYLLSLLFAVGLLALAGCESRTAVSDGEPDPTLKPGSPPELLRLESPPVAAGTTEPRAHGPVVVPSSLPADRSAIAQDWWQELLAPDSPEDFSGPELNAPRLDSTSAPAALPAMSAPPRRVEGGIAPPPRYRLERMPQVEMQPPAVGRLDRGHAIPSWPAVPVPRRPLAVATLPSSSPSSSPPRSALPLGSASLPLGSDSLPLGSASLPTGTDLPSASARPLLPSRTSGWSSGAAARMTPRMTPTMTPTMTPPPASNRFSAVGTPVTTVARATVPRAAVPRAAVPRATVPYPTVPRAEGAAAARPWQQEVSLPSREPPRLAPSTAAPPVEDPMLAVNQRAEQLIAQGDSLAARGAHYSARADFVQALRLITQANDALHQTNIHSKALAAALRALREADDFVPQGTCVEADLNLPQIITSHRTPVLKDSAQQANLTALVVLQSYYTYAQQQFALAAAGNPAGSQALYSLARLHSLLAEQSPAQGAVIGPKALALHQAALMTDPTNYRAANELGVLLSRYGQHAQARSVLLHGVSVSPRPELWHNLAAVHEQLGDAQQAERARHECRLAVQRQSLPGAEAAGEPNVVRWVDPESFRSQPASRATVTSPATAGDRSAARGPEPSIPRSAKKPGRIGDWFPW